MSTQYEKKSFIDYLYILYKWKKLILINMFIILVLVTIYSFLIPKTYKATSSIIIPNQGNGIGNLSSLVSSANPMLSFGAQFLSGNATSQDFMLGLLNSRTILTAAIKKFDLMKYYDISDSNMDKTLKSFKNDVIFEPDENGLLEISVINKNPQQAATIANFFVQIADSMNIILNIEQAKNNRVFIEKRYKQNLLDLKAAEDSLYKFQKKYGIVAVPEQLEATFKAAAEIESQLSKKEIEAYFLQQQYGNNSPQYKGVMAEIRVLKDKVQELKNSPNLSSSSNILFPFNEMPDISIQYLRLFREVEIQQQIQEIVMPMYEQAKVEEQKSIPTIQVLDRAVPPELKYAPKKVFIISFVFFIVLFMHLPFVFIGEKYSNQLELDNELVSKIKSFYAKLKKIYKMRGVN